LTDARQTLPAEISQSFKTDGTSTPVAFDFSSNNICSGKFPFSIWARLLREVVSEKDARLLEVTPYNGADELRQAIADHLRQYRAMTISPDQIIIGAGAEYLYGLIIQLLGRHCVYAIENPGYSKMQAIVMTDT